MGIGQQAVVVIVLEALAALVFVMRVGQSDEVAEVGVLAVDVDGTTGGCHRDLVAVDGADPADAASGVIEAMVAGQGHVVVDVVIAAAGLGVVVGHPASSPQMPSFPEIVD